MSWKTFGQAVLLIAAFFFAYWLLLKVRDREVSAAYPVAAASEAPPGPDNVLMSNDITTADLRRAENTVAAPR